MPDSLITVTSGPRARRQLTGAVKVNRHIAQVAVVNAHHLRLQDDGALQFLFIADFGQHAHIQGCEPPPRADDTVHRRAPRASADRRRGLIVARQVDLVRVDGEVLTLRIGCGATRADDRQEIEAALEIFLITQHRRSPRRSACRCWRSLPDRNPRESTPSTARPSCTRE